MQPLWHFCARICHPLSTNLWSSLGLPGPLKMALLFTMWVSQTTQFYEYFSSTTHVLPSICQIWQVVWLRHRAWSQHYFKTFGTYSFLLFLVLYERPITHKRVIVEFNYIWHLFWFCDIYRMFWLCIDKHDVGEEGCYGARRPCWRSVSLISCLCHPKTTP